MATPPLTTPVSTSSSVSSLASTSPLSTEQPWGPEEDAIKDLVILGSTGSVGTQTLEIVASQPARLRVKALAAGHNIEKLIEQVQQFQPQSVAVATPAGADALKQALPHYHGQVLVGEAGLEALVSQAPHVLVGLVGFLGVAPTLKALQQGATVYTANKETLVAAGHLVKPYLEQIIPLDSEHSALFQCLGGKEASRVRTLWLTASGGPFLRTPLEQLKDVTPEQALKHPNWVMGPKVTIDSATLMNKGLELIEAQVLFGVAPEQLRVVIHPQSVLHSLVEYRDGSILAQLGPTDMRLPIQAGLSYPSRWPLAEACRKPFSLDQVGSLELTPPDRDRFSALRLAEWAMQAGGSLACVLNAANEEAVALFLNRQLSFLGMASLVEKSMTRFASTPLPQTLEGLTALHHEVRAWSRQIAVRTA
jgi:1-deoxy-D-xylulose-5-phosphate reductoisomerase